VKPYAKTVIRSIKGSFARFVSIFAIIALGVGFLSGLNLTKPSFYETADVYIKDCKMYDFRLLSTIGFDNDDIASIAKTDGVVTCVGAYFQDAVVNLAEDKYTVRFNSVTGGVNELKLESGRLPEKSGEIVVDGYMFSSDVIGQKITLSSENSSDISDNFKVDEFTVVGTVRSPVYMNFQVGTTSVGSGSLNFYIYALADDFDQEYYTEAYVFCDTPYYIYSDEYEDFAEGEEALLETRVGDTIDSRWDSILRDTYTEYYDAEDEFNEARIEADGELSDAWEELKSAAQELSDARVELADGAEELDDAKTELADAKKELDSAKSELKEAEVTLNASKSQLDSAKKTLDDTKSQLDAAASGIASGKEQLAAAREELATQKETLQATESQLNGSIESINSGLSQTESGMAEIESALADLESSKTQLEAAISQTEAIGGDTTELESQLATVTSSIESLKSQYDSLAATKSSLAENLAECEAGLESVAAGYSQISEAEAELENQSAALTAAQAEYESGLAQYEAGLDEYNTGLAAYNKGKAEYDSGLAEYNSGLAEYNDGLAEYESGLAEYEDGLAEYEEGREKYRDGLSEYVEGRSEFNSKMTSAVLDLMVARKSIDSLEDPVTYVLGRDTNTGYVSFENDAAIVGGIAAVFPVFFFAIAALVCSTTMSRMVADERGQIGTMRALGYSGFAIVMKYVIYSGVATILGAVPGYLVGYRFFPWCIWLAYDTMYGFSDLVPKGSVLVFALTFAGSMLCSVGVTIIACISELKSTPADLIRPKAPAPGKRILLERIDFVWARMKFLHKVSARNVFRFKKRMWMMIIGIAGCQALLLTGFGIKDTIADIVNLHFDNLAVYDLTITFDDGTSASEMAAAIADADASAGTSSEYATAMTATAKQYGDLIRDVSLVISDSENISDICRVFNTSTGLQEDWPADGTVAISRKLSERLGISAGDSITFEYGDDAIEVTVPVSVVFENYIYHYVYMSPSTFTGFFGEKYKPETVFICLDDSSKAYDYAAYVASNYDLSAWQVTSEMRDNFSNTMERLNYVILMIIICAGALAFIVLFNLNNINITERIREIATLKVMGFNRGETVSYVYRENIILVLIGYILGIPLGILLLRFVIGKVDVDIVMFVTQLFPQSYLYTFLLIIAFSLLAAVFILRKIEKIDMAESLKSVE